MIRSVRRAVMVMMYAVVGAVAGRVAMDLRQRHLRGEPLEVKLDASSLRPQEIVPGLIAAMRVRDRPWSYLHIPGWFAAFAVNFAVSALGRELRPIDDEDAEARSVLDATADPRPVVTTSEAGPGTAAATEPGGDAGAGFTPFDE
ncbi:MAG: hypothetical protein F4X26_09580 [Chloroflexi bacterium]|nr:hypothetical protein [Chloroflexota bacterium]